MRKREREGVGKTQWWRNANNITNFLNHPLCSGDGLLFKGDVVHRGSAHTDPNAPSRLVFFVIFNNAREGSEDERMVVGSEDMQMTYAQRFGFWGLDISTFKWLDAPFGLWRVTHAAILGSAYLKRVGTALKWWKTDSYMPLTYIDAFCLLRFKGARSESFGSDNEGNGFFLEDFEKFVTSFEASRHLIDIIVWASSLIAGASFALAWCLFSSTLVITAGKQPVQAKEQNGKKYNQD